LGRIDLAGPAPTARRRRPAGPGTGRLQHHLRQAVPGPALAALALPLAVFGAAFAADVGGARAGLGGGLGHGLDRIGAGGHCSRVPSPLARRARPRRRSWPARALTLRIPAPVAPAWPGIAGI